MTDDDRFRLAAAYAHGDHVARRNSKTFYLATALLPRASRRAVRALYAFCRTTDDLVDNHGATQADLARWRAAVVQPVGAQRDPVLLCWADTRERYGVDGRYEAELIDGVALDLEQTRYANWPELERYCYLVASTVGLLSMPLIGLARGVSFAEAEPYAVKLGIALQLTNILRDVGEDAALGRVYLPATDLGRFGLTAEDVLRGVHDERFVALLRFEIARARRLFDEAMPGIALLSPTARPAVCAAAILYRAILDRIEAIDYRVHTERAHTTGVGKLRLLPGILWTALTLRPPGAAGAAGAGVVSARPAARVDDDIPALC
ncbi:MAG: squalene/phytoene synthase family protein [Ardenticatenales bacterium]|nr:squalene/phytoene synthase family protein [Ardenticatenales bacterium]